MSESANWDSSTGDIVTSWTVTSASNKGIDYDKLIEKFGCQKIDASLIERIENITGKKAHHLLKHWPWSEFVCNALGPFDSIPVHEVITSSEVCSSSIKNTRSSTYMFSRISFTASGNWFWYFLARCLMNNENGEHDNPKHCLLKR
ncbi:Tryptophan--tRNA ligase, cytoplasmic [Trichinella zimbabwensis]|nr:Tryptophan--tRNA ligase, cytoplasmic [Trichinella zimbabwensis]